MAAVTSLVIAELQDLVRAHRPHGELFADASSPGPNGYRLTVRCHCGIVFERHITPEDDGVETVLLARWN